MHLQDPQQGIIQAVQGNGKQFNPQNLIFLVSTCWVATWRKFAWIPGGGNPQSDHRPWGNNESQKKANLNSKENWRKSEDRPGKWDAFEMKNREEE
jgi:hypothetical protein